MLVLILAILAIASFSVILFYLFFFFFYPSGTSSLSNALYCYLAKSFLCNAYLDTLGV